MWDPLLALASINVGGAVKQPAKTPKNLINELLKATCFLFFNHENTEMKFYKRIWC
jgi:hypothetical protein